MILSTPLMLAKDHYLDDFRDEILGVMRSLLVGILWASRLLVQRRTAPTLDSEKSA